MEILVFALFGLVSGIATSWILQPVQFGNFSLWPGLLFGVAIVLVFIWRRSDRTWAKLIGFIFLSIISYYLAFKTTEALSIFLNHYPTWILYFFGGLVGALSLSLGFSWLLYRLKWKTVATLALLGGVLGIIGLFVSVDLCPRCYWWDFGGGGGTGFNPLYIIWQTGMALGFGILS